MSDGKQDFLRWLSHAEQTSQTNHVSVYDKLIEISNGVKEYSGQALASNLASTDGHLVRLDDGLAELTGKVDCAMQQTMHHFAESTKATDLLIQLESEKKLSEDLRSKLQQREAELENMEDATAKEREDHATIEAARDRLEHIQSKLAETDGLSDKLDSILRASTVIQQTSAYLNDQSEWVNRQVPTSSSLVEVPSSVTDSNVSCSFTRSNQIDRGAVSEESKANPTLQASQNISRGMRRVVITSPTAPESPHPITVEQEQIRRRQGSQLKPILRGPPEASRSKIRIPAKPGTVETEFISHTRTGLAGKNSLQRGYPFPTVAEFMKSSLAETNTNAQYKNTRETGVAGDPPSKRQQRLLDGRFFATST